MVIIVFHVSIVCEGSRDVYKRWMVFIISEGLHCCLLTQVAPRGVVNDATSYVTKF